MIGNLVLEQYGRYKKMELEASPFHFLLDAHIELNPHQLNAFCAAISALKTGGIILADEVGLGKTIEAGLVLKYIIAAGATRILIVLPASLRKQWALELEDKFELDAIILDRLTVEQAYSKWKGQLLNGTRVRIVLVTYDYASKLMKRFPMVHWDFIIIDEAHNLRNVFRGTKRAKSLFDLSIGIPKLLLTATPLQNSLTDLHGLVSFIDPRIFGSEEIFRARYIEGHDYSFLKQQLSPVLFRTLRKDAAKYMHFQKRICKTVDFTLSPDEIALYQCVNEFLKKAILYCVPTNNKSLIILVIRKLLASSSFALIETFEVLKNRLEKLYEGTKSSDAQEGFDLFWSLVEDEIDEEGLEDREDENVALPKQLIQEELDEVSSIISFAKRIQVNAKAEALHTALQIAFDYQKEQDIPQKAVVFTESKRTQKYIAAELRKNGFSDEDILLFNGSFDDVMAKDIYKAWQVKNFGNVNYGRSVEYKHAIVDYFRHHAKVMICTDAGSEGLNLQFCNTVINYDLPWNPMKIEQRIGRCHRYGQEHDVVAINLLNTQNEADRRVYEILSNKFSLFNGVFGSSDIALGTLESGISFEKTILEIYQTCNTAAAFKMAFDKLERRLNARRDRGARELRTLLLTESKAARGEALASAKEDLARYLDNVAYWAEVDAPEVDEGLYYWRVEYWGEQVLGFHGRIIVGGFYDGIKFLSPVLILSDENGNLVDIDEADLVGVLERIDDMDVHYDTPSAAEQRLCGRLFERIRSKMLQCHQEQSAPIKEYNRRKVENWQRIQVEQMTVTHQEMIADIEALKAQERQSTLFYEKVDLRKKITEKTKELETFQGLFYERERYFQEGAAWDIEEFDKQFEIDPVLSVNIVLKF